MDWIFKNFAAPSGHTPIPKYMARFPARKNQLNEHGDYLLNLGKFAKATVEGKVRYYKVDINQQAFGDVVLIAPGTLTGATVVVSDVKKATKAGYLLYTIRDDQGLKITLWGFLIGVAGVVIDAVFKIGDIKGINWPTISPAGALTWQLIGMVLKVLGLALVFWKGVIDRK